MERGVVSSDELAALLKASNLDVSTISLERAIELYERARKLEWMRSSTIHVRS
jgi:exonuclease VII small subunit